MFIFGLFGVVPFLSKEGFVGAQMGPFLFYNYYSTVCVTSSRAGRIVCECSHPLSCFHTGLFQI